MENRPGTVDELTSLYRETILKHAVSPVGFEVEINVTHRYEIYNPLCGDRIEMQLQVEGDNVEAIAFRGEACAICMASASLLCENHGCGPITDLEAAHTWLESELVNESSGDGYCSLRPLLGVKAFPSRVKCALLPWEAAEKAIRG